MNIPSQLSTVNERLTLALESTRQIAFDWHIADDRLYFSGELADELKSVPLDTSRVWQSRALPALIHDADKERFQKHLRNALKGIGSETGDFYRVELRLKDTGREWRWVDISGSIVERDPNGRALRMVGTFFDIDERKQAETRVEYLRDLYVALSQINQAIIRLHDRDALFHEVCRIAVEQGQFQGAWIDLADEHKQSVVTIAGRGRQTDGSGKFSLPVGTLRPGSRSVISAAGIGSIACIPFALPEQSTGTLHLRAEKADFFDERLLDLLEDMTAGLALAISDRTRAIQVNQIVGTSGASAFSAFARDMVALKQSQASLRGGAARYRRLVELSPEAILVCRNATIELLNPAAARLLGAPEVSGVLGRSVLDFVHPTHHALYQERACAPSEGVPSMPFAEQVWSKLNGAALHVEIAVVDLIYDGGLVAQIVVRDISERKRAEALQSGQTLILNMVATGAALPDILLEIARFAESLSNQTRCSILRVNSNDDTLDGAIPSPARSTQPAATPQSSSNESHGTAVIRPEPAVVAGVAGVAKESPPNPRSQPRPAFSHDEMRSSSWPIRSKSNKVVGVFSLHFPEAIPAGSHDRQLVKTCIKLAATAIESRATEEKIRLLAHYDGLTSLPNRFLFDEYLDLALRNAQRHASKFAVFFLDLDKFKEINDTLGHAAGDRVLLEIATRLRGCLRDTDKIARMGGDEFYILIEELSDGRYAADVAQKLLDAASRPIRVDGHDCLLSASIGIAIYPDDGEDGAALLKNADGAMYRAKDVGRNACRFHSAPHVDDREAAAARESSGAFKERGGGLARTT